MLAYFAQIQVSLQILGAGTNTFLQLPHYSWVTGSMLFFKGSSYNGEKSQIGHRWLTAAIAEATICCAAVPDCAYLLHLCTLIP